YRVKARYGLSDTFLLTGVTTQGGPPSPLKSTVTSSMASHWLASRIFNDGLNVSSTNHLTPDTPADSQLWTNYGGLIPTSSLAAVHQMTHMMKFSQTAYGLKRYLLAVQRGVCLLIPFILASSQRGSCRVHA
ncbi:hypothetical protein R3P38DRAFT_2582968, partial [Favolaschia claudopus]